MLIITSKFCIVAMLLFVDLRTSHVQYADIFTIYFRIKFPIIIILLF